jgi:hypothetical protein
MSERSSVSSTQQSFINLSECVENEFCEKIDEEDFFELIDIFGIDLSDFLKKKTSLNQENLKKFNQFIFRCKSKLGIDITSSLIFIEKQYTTFNKLFDLLTEDNKEILRREMSEKYHIKIQKNSLKQFLVF